MTIEDTQFIGNIATSFGGGLVATAHHCLSTSVNVLDYPFLSLTNIEFSNNYGKHSGYLVRIVFKYLLIIVKLEW